MCIINIFFKNTVNIIVIVVHLLAELFCIVPLIGKVLIKIPDATPEIISFVMDYGKMYGYTFEHEATYDRMCLVNDAVYIAKYKDGKHAGEWTATGTQFQIPYVFKKLFSKEEIVFEDMCETKSVSTALYLDMNESLNDVSEFEKQKESYLKEIKKNGKEPDKEYLLKLENEIAKGHNYIFVGKVGNFCPIKIFRGAFSLKR